MVASAFGEDETGGRQTRLTVDDLKYLFMKWLGSFYRLFCQQKALSIGLFLGFGRSRFDTWRLFDNRSRKGVAWGLYQLDDYVSSL